MEFDLRDIPTRQTLKEYSVFYPELDVTAVETYLLFLRAASEVFTVSDHHLSQFGLSRGKVTLLMLLIRNAETGLPPSELAARAGVTRGTITGLLDGLERDGLVERHDHPSDRRMYTIHLTEGGLALMQKLLPMQFMLISQMMSELAPEERTQLVELLAKIRKGVESIDAV
ncbi:MarR family winged helix-turn-helix transcriptional regulator [Brevibacillus fluminis]|uniref:MarR family winged helix-turn-helix transcriptional regulator n=1 Tax=Brevibacillus fluminis TaxID=511487 RepID=UPI003F8C6E5E